MNRSARILGVVVLYLGLMIPAISYAGTVADFVHQNATDPKAATKTIVKALDAASDEMVAHYRTTEYKDPLMKQAALKRADQVLYAVEHIDNRALTNRILDAYGKTPNIELKDVVMGYLLDASKTVKLPEAEGVKARE